MIFMSDWTLQFNFKNITFDKTKRGNDDKEDASVAE